MDIVRISVPANGNVVPVFPVSGSQMNPESVQALQNLSSTVTIEILSGQNDSAGDGIPIPPGGTFIVANGQEPAWAVIQSGSTAAEVVTVAALGTVTLPLTAGSLTAEDVSTGTLETSGNAAVGGSLTVTGAFGANGTGPAGKAAAYTQTYSTTARTVSNATVAAVATTGSSQSTPWGYSTQAQADAIPVAINALAADVLALKKVIGALIDDSQAVGIAG